MHHNTGEQRRKPSFGERMKASWWPAVDTLNGARKATMYGVHAVIVIVVFTSAALFLIPEYFGGPTMFWVVVGQLGIFALIGFFIWCNSRSAAVIGMALFLADRIAQFGEVPFNPGNIIVMFAIALGFLHAIRGTFAHHRLKEMQGAVS